MNPSMTTFQHHVRGLFCVTAVPPSLFSCRLAVPSRCLLRVGAACGLRLRWAIGPDTIRSSARLGIGARVRDLEVEHEGPTVRWLLIFVLHPII